MRSRKRLSFDALENRALMHGGAVAPLVPPTPFAAELLARRELIGHHGPKPLDMASYIAPSETPVILGDTVEFTIVTAPGTGGVPTTTIWTYTIDEGGTTSGIMNLPGGVLATTLTASIPGDYEIVAMTAYAPPIATTTTLTYSFTVSPPDTVSKGGGAGVANNIWTTALLSDPVTFQGPQGYDLGPSVGGTFQDSIAPWVFNGTTQVQGTNGWQNVNYFADAIHEPVSLPVGPMMWWVYPAGPLGTYTEQYQYTWTMQGADGASYSFTAPMNSLSWTESKIDGSNWMVS
jgi:hypothetical protein